MQRQKSVSHSPLCTVTLIGELLEPTLLLPTHMYVPASDILMLGMSRVPMSVRACRGQSSSVHSDGREENNIQIKPNACVTQQQSADEAGHLPVPAGGTTTWQTQDDITS